MMHRTFPIFLLGCIGVVACDQTVHPNPAPAGGVDDAGEPDAPAVSTQPDAGDAAAEIPPDDRPVRRTVSHRSPFGNLDHTDNLLIDGDMEMTSGAGQTPWVALKNYQQVGVKLETGGRCRSGLRCLVLDNAANAVLGYGVAAGDKPLEFWMWAKVPSDRCDAVTVYLFPRMTMHMTAFHAVPPETEAPDEEGWCRFHALRSAMNESVGVYVRSELVGDNPLQNAGILIDDAVLRPADGVSPTALRSSPISKQEHARVIAEIAPLLRQRWIGPPGQQPRE